MLLVASAMQADVDRLRDCLKDEEVGRALVVARKLSDLRLASVLVEAPLPTLLAFLQRLDVARAAEVLAHFPDEFTVKVLSELDPDWAQALFPALPAERLASLIELLPDDLNETLLATLDEQQRALVDTLASYPEDAAGALMSPRFLSVPAGTLVGEVIEALRATVAQAERTAYVFVVSAQTGRLSGVVSLRELMMADPRALVDRIMTSEVYAVRDDEDALEAARRIRSRRLKMLPVVNDADRLVGVISIGQAMDLLSQEVADEFVAMSAASPDESFYTPPREAVKKRLPWMAANIFLNLGAVLVISRFEDTIVQVAILAAFLPMITDMGGNVGIQALSVSIRSMALGEARLRDFWKAVRKEFAIGLFNGVALGALFCVVAYFLEGNMVLGIVAGVALACNVLLAGVVGGTMPFLIKRLGKDPAMMTGPILTTITDITGVTVYLGLCTVFLTSLL